MLFRSDNEVSRAFGIVYTTQRAFFKEALAFLMGLLANKIVLKPTFFPVNLFKMISAELFPTAWAVDAVIRAYRKVPTSFIAFWKEAVAW